MEKCVIGKVLKNTDIDVNYNFLNDNTENEAKYDPDQSSKTLLYYHQKLWSKEENNIKLDFEIKIDDWNNKSLILVNKYATEENQKIFSSDWIINDYQHWDRNKWSNLKYLDSINSNTLKDFNNIANTIGGRIIFPKRQIDGKKNTINTHRGTHTQICDRFDITLECIRRFFCGIESIPDFDDTLKRYDFFFKLFGSSNNGFENYCNFFLLQDLVSDDYKEIKYFIRFNGFINNPFPKCEETYMEFIEKTTEFIKKRNVRIKEWVENNK